MIAWLLALWSRVAGDNKDEGNDQVKDEILDIDEVVAEENLIRVAKERAQIGTEQLSETICEQQQQLLKQLLPQLPQQIQPYQPQLPLPPPQPRRYRGARSRAIRNHQPRAVNH